MTSPNNLEQGKVDMDHRFKGRRRNGLDRRGTFGRYMSREMSEGERAKADGADSIMYPATQTSSSKDECPPLMPSSATLPQMLAMTANVCAHRKFSKILATKTSNLDCTLDLTPVRPNDEQ